MLFVFSVMAGIVGEMHLTGKVNPSNCCFRVARSTIFTFQLGCLVFQKTTILVFKQIIRGGTSVPTIPAIQVPMKKK